MKEKNSIKLRRTITINRRTFKIIILIAVMMVLIFITKALPQDNAPLTGKAIASSDSDFAVQQSNSQEITMTIDSSGWNPTQFVLKKGVPVKWKINGISLTGCNRMIIAPDFNIRYNVQQGENIIEFTPDKVGAFTFTCSMGMMRGTFIVTETGTATQEQVNTAQAQRPQGGGCGMGGGGCGCGGM